MTAFAAAIMGACWFIVYLILRLFCLPLSTFSQAVTLPNHALEMAAQGGDLESDSFKHTRSGCLTVLLFPVWFPLACVMAVGHLFWAIVFLILFNPRLAKQHFMLAEEGFRF